MIGIDTREGHMRAMRNEILGSSFARREESERIAPLRRGQAISRAVRATDWVLRHIYHVREFTDDPDCLLRISQRTLAHDVAPGTFGGIGADAVLIELHLWNEHLPPFPAEGPTVAWATDAERLVEHSLHLLACHIASRPDFANVYGLHAVTPFASKGSSEKLIRLAQRFGFDAIAPQRQSWAGRARQAVSNVLIAGLVQAYNPRGLHKSKIIRAYVDLWMSREVLLARYGTGLT